MPLVVPKRVYHVVGHWEALVVVSERAVPGMGPGLGDIAGECPKSLYSGCSESEKKLYVLKVDIQYKFFFSY